MIPQALSQEWPLTIARCTPKPTKQTNKNKNQSEWGQNKLFFRPPAQIALLTVRKKKRMKSSARRAARAASGGHGQMPGWAADVSGRDFTSIWGVCAGTSCWGSSRTESKPVIEFSDLFKACFSLVPPRQLVANPIMPCKVQDPSMFF